MTYIKTSSGELLKVVAKDEVTHRCGKVTSFLKLQNVKLKISVEAQSPIADVLKQLNLEASK